MPYLRYLDGLRCLSILWVILIHLKLPGDALFNLVASRGWMGVDMFFVISGFLITSILLHEHRATGGISLRRFYARRILRIWPAYYLLVGLTLAFASLVTAAHWTPYWQWSRMALGTIQWPATYLTNAYAGFHRTENCAILVSWSLSLEEQFYLLWPLLLFLDVRRAWKLAVAAILVVTAWRTWLTFHLAPGVDAMRRLFYAPDTRLDVILYGALLAYLLFDEERAASIGKFVNRAVTPVVLAAALVFAVYINNRWSGHLGNSLGYSVSALVMAAGIAWIQTSRPAWILRILEHRSLVFCGRISYGMYLFHGIVLALLLHEFGRPTSPVAETLFGLGVVGGTVFVAFLSYRYFESRFLRMKKRYSVVGAATT